MPSGTLFDVPSKIARKKELEDKMGQPGFWDHQETAKPVVAEVKTLKAQIEPLEAVLRELGDVSALYELGSEAGDQDSLNEADQTLHKLEKRAERVELQSLLDGENDPRNC